MKKIFGLCIAGMLFAGSLAGCGPLSNTKSSNSSKTQTSSEALIAGDAQSASGPAKTVQAPVALPPSYDSRPPKPGQSNTQTMPNGLPALQTKGVNVDTLFSQEMGDTNARFERVENAVLDLRREFESFKPAIVRLVAVESDIQDLVKQLDILLRNEPAMPAPAMQAQSAPTALTPQDTQPSAQPAPPPREPAPAPAANNWGGPTVKSLRIGEHSDKTRLVLDLNRASPYSVDLDAAEKLLIIETPEASWSASRQQSFSRSALLASYNVESINNGKGSRVIISLKKGTQILKKQALPPGPNPNFRIFIDLQK